MLANEINNTADLEPLDPEYVNQRLSKPPFVTVPGVVNIRDLGSYPSSRHCGMVTRPRLLYRSGEISSITEEGEDIAMVSQIHYSARLTATSHCRQRAAEGARNYSRIRSTVRY